MPPEKKSCFIFLYLFFFVCTTGVRMPCPFSTKIVALLPLNASLTLPIPHPSGTAPPPTAPSAGVTRDKKKTQGHGQSMDTSQGWQSFNNLGLEKLDKYIYYQDLSTCYYQLTYWVKGLLCSYQMARRALGKHLWRTVLSNPKQAKSLNLLLFGQPIIHAKRRGNTVFLLSFGFLPWLGYECDKIKW